eukprot:TRINITY_DN40102_c0_g1_i1.p1 TRINITY_DN40102_c0_g1~~TRINITY_DN40102_c0_g1_i1.p1  ORF type:complete len:288 (-),score=65.21 TRINITY_DN40102_c0_g1_i1:213-1076(-)
MTLSVQRISEAERKFLYDGVAQGLRNDGRGCFDYRRISFEVGTVPTATGSCRLRAGETDVIVGIKSDVGKPSPAQPDCGNCHIVVECAASVSQRFAHGRDAEDVGKQLSTLLESLCASDSIVDRKALCLLPGTFAWDVYVDVLVLSSGGNLLDSVSLAICAALSETILPDVIVQEAMEEGELTQLRVDDRPEVGKPFPLKRLPLCVTVAQVKDRFLLDVTAEEELCADALLCVVVDGKSGEVIGMHQIGRGLFNAALLPLMLERCRAVAGALVCQMEREMVFKSKGS